MQPFEIMISESQERMAAIVEPARLAEVEAVCARWQLPCTAIGQVTDDGRLRCRYDGEVVGRHARRGARRRAALSAPRRAARRPGRARARAPTRCRRSPIRRALLLAPAGGAQHLRQDLGLRAVRPGRGLGHRRPPGRRRRRRAPDAVRARDRRRAGRRRRARRARPAARRRRGRRAGGAQRRLQRRRARGDHELPQLRQPRAPGHRLRAARGDHGHGRGLRGARHAGRVRQRLALQRERRPADPPDARRRLRRRAGAGRCGRARRARRTRAGRCSRSARPTPAYDGSEWQALVAGASAGRIPEVDLPALRWLCDLLGELARDRVLSSAHDVSDGGLAVALAEVALACGQRASRPRSSRATTRRRRSSASAAGSSS